LEFTLFAADKHPKVIAESTGGRTKKAARRQGGLKFERQWEKPCDIQVFAMLLADNYLHVLGARDVLNELDRSNLSKDNAEQDEHMLGKHGSVLAVVDPTTGDRVRQYEYDFFPTFDGVSAADGRIYVACQNGTVVCLKADGS
jgi:outer membrane protein assembly factor BamB